MPKERGVSRANFLRGMGQIARVGAAIALYEAVKPYTTAVQHLPTLRKKGSPQRPTQIQRPITHNEHDVLGDSRHLNPVAYGFLTDAFYRLFKGGSEEVEIDPSDIHATRPFLTEERLEGRPKHHSGRRAEVTRETLVIEDDGNYYAVDGHHKTRRAGKEGKKIKARVVHNTDRHVSERLQRSDHGSVMDLPVVDDTPESEEGSPWYKKYYLGDD